MISQLPPPRHRNILKRLVFMKKISILLALILSVCTVRGALAAEAATPWNTSGMNIYIFEDFSSFADTEIDQSTPGFELYSSSLTHLMRITDGCFRFYDGGAADMYFNLALPVNPDGRTQFSSALGMGFYIENNTAGDVIIGWQSKNRDGKQYICTGLTYCYDTELEEYYPCDTDDTWDIHCMPIIEAGFKGYVLFPFGSLINRSTGIWDASDYIDSLGLIIRGGVLNPETEEDIIIDNMFIYGTEADNNAGRIQGMLTSATEAPTVSPSASDASAAPTPSQTAPGSPQTPGKTWIYIAVGIVIAAGSAVIILTLKKKPEPNGKDKPGAD